MSRAEPAVRRPSLRRLGGFVWLALAGMIAAGCGGSSSTRTVPTLPGRHVTPTASSTRLTLAQSDRDMITFARCMRAHGVQMSDPFHRSGHSGLSVDLPTRDAATALAYDACNRFIQPIVQAKQGAAASEPPVVLAALTAYARCMRAHDIGMHDPTPQGALSLGNVPGAMGDFGRYSPQFRSADGVCRHLLPASVHDDGTGP